MNVRRLLRRTTLHLVMILLCLAWLLPLWSSLLVGFKTTQEYLSQKFWELPGSFVLLDNIREAWVRSRVGVAYVNSVLYGVVAGFGSIAVSSLAAFSLVWYRPRFGFTLFAVIWSGTIFPLQMYLVPLFRTYLEIGLYDTRLGLFLFYIAIAIPFGVFVFRGFFSSLPREGLEAARLDGASDLGILRRVVLPQSRSSMAVLMLFTFIWVWNDLVFGLVLTRSASARPVMAAISTLIGAYTGGTNYPILMAGALVVSIPTLAIFVFLQKHFISGLVMTSVGR